MQRLGGLEEDAELAERGTGWPPFSRWMLVRPLFGGQPVALSLLLLFGMLVGCPVLASGQDEKASAKKNEQVADDELRRELLRMRDEDQAAREKLNEWLKASMAAGGKDPKRLSADAPEIKRLHEIDRKNTERLKVITKKHGWPGKCLVGEEAASAAWLLLQHADHDRPFQRRCLQLMEEAAKKGEVSQRDVAYLVDRLLVADGKKQRYGTQFKLEKNDWVPSPIEDEANVDKRRAELDMPPLAEYKKMILKQYVEKAKEDKGKEVKK